MRTVALTGGSGFLGTHLTNYFKTQNFNVIQIGRVSGTNDIIEKLKGHNVEVVYHLATCYIPEHKTEDVENLISSNVLYGTQLFEAMSQLGIKKLVMMGTGWQRWKENQKTPVNLYAATKSALDEIVSYYVDANAFQVIRLMLFDTYGLEDNRPKLIPALIDQLKTKNSKSFQLSPGEQLIDMVHIEDVLSCILAATERLASIENSDSGVEEEFLISSGQPMPLKELVMELEAMSGQSLNIEWGAKPYRKREVFEPWSQGKRLPTWEPKYNMQTGFKELLEHNGLLRN